MTKEFDVVRDRRQSNSVKWDGLETLYGEADLLAMWVADMDFDPAPAIKERLTNLASEQVLGYVLPPETLFETYIDWQREQHQIELKKEEILFSPGVVGSIGVIIQAFTEQGDGVLIHDPAYNGFTPIIEDNHRKLERSPLQIENGKFKMDFEDIEHQFKGNNIKVFLLSNPHNPGGRVWTKDELTQLMDLCVEYDVLLVSDEIHSDLIYSDQTMISAYTLDEKYFDHIILLHSPTKTFNLAGAKVSTIVVKDPELRKQIKEVQSYTQQGTINTFGLVAMEAAFGESQEWHKNLLKYLEENRNYIINFFDEHLPEVEYMVPESTYLMWFNAESIGLSGEELNQHFVKEGQIALVNGQKYGKSSPIWTRLNFGTSRENLEDGLNRIKKAFEKAK